MAIRRVSIGPGEVAGYFSRLKTGFDELGVPCEHFVLDTNKYAYHESEYFLKATFQHIAPLINNVNFALRQLGWIAQICIRALALIYALVRCDVFIFSGFGSFFRFYELPLIKLMGKKIIVIYLGSDARPPIFSGRHLDDAGGYVVPVTALVEAKRMLRQIRRVEKHASLIINHTATAQLFNHSFIRFMAVGMPSHVGATKSATPEVSQTNSIRILHAPSRPRAKGSFIIEKIMNELRAEGYAIDYIELVGVSNDIVLQELQLCDFIVDELYSDVPLAMLATEAAAFGKPAVVGGYYAEQYKIDNPDSEFPPSLYVEPEKLKQAIREMIDNREFRLALGRKAQAFVRDKWAARKVANNYLKLVEDNFPMHWMCTPLTLPYYWGWGLSKESWRKQVGAYVSQFGPDALLFNDNLGLKEMVLDEIQRSAA